ncbi:MAG: DNA (cytosine-5-)-methyltransferase [Anaerolineaceae bacterium 4572_78]|nr:MAG: DNA (cytosine-5-)-methyltransferase [Anaerolineaceae bacterium 4572_78]
MKVIDLFAGCGGMSLGFMNAGCELCASYDNWQAAINVHKKNFSHPIFKVDLYHGLENISTFQKHEPDIIIGGPPCQDFSSAGKRNESLGRANLTIIFAQIVCQVKPTWFVMENVPRIVKTKTYLKTWQIFQNANYQLVEIFLDASFCGVPQKRKRLFLIGKLNQDIGRLNYLLEKNLTKHPMSVREYLGDSISVNHYYRHPRSYKRRGIFSIDEPSPTIRGVNRPLPCGYPGHQGDTAPVSEKIRALTTKERSLIQTFPPYFIWEGTKSNLEQMIGNAVPVKLAEHVAKAILDYADKEYQQIYYSQANLFSQ